MPAALTRMFSAISRIVRHQRIHPGTPLRKYPRYIASAARVNPRVKGVIALARRTACIAGRDSSVAPDKIGVKIE